LQIGYDILMQYSNAQIIVLLTHGILFMLVISAGITDLKWNCIYNWQTYTAILLGLSLNFWNAGWHGLLGSFSGLVTGFALLFVFYLLGGFGAGDVKFLAAIGALKGVEFVLWTMAYSALVGGIMAFAAIIWKGMFWSTIKKCFYLVCHPLRAHKELNETPQLYLPYGLAISIGCCWTFLAL
jgi:prepilin peptidase CpaA